MEEYSHNMNFVGVVGSPHNFSNCFSGQTICCCGSGLVASNVISDQLTTTFCSGVYPLEFSSALMQTLLQKLNY
jgi:hypothetical protein